MDKNLTERVAELEERVGRLERSEAPAPAAQYRQIYKSPIAPVPPSVAHEGSDMTFENFFGARVLLRVGVTALIFAVGFFMKYAFDQGLLSDLAKVLVIALFGGLIIACGEFFARKYPIFGQVIIGGGIAIWFFDVVAARVLYSFVSGAVALVLALLLAALTLAYSHYRDSQPMLIASLGGAYLAPLFLSQDRTLTEFIVYAVIITASAAWFLHRKAEWNAYLFFPLIGFAIQFCSWYAVGNRLSPGAVALVVTFALMIACIVRAAQLHKKQELSVALLLSEGVVSGVLMYVVLFQDAQFADVKLIGLLMPGIAALISVAAAFWLYSAADDKKKDSVEEIVLNVMALFFAAMACANYFTDKWVVFAWALLSIIVGGIGAGAKRAWLAWGAFALAIFALFRFIGNDNGLTTMPDTSVWINTNTMLLALFVIVFTLYAWIAHVHEEAGMRALRIPAFIFAQLVAMALVLHQVSAYFTLSAVAADAIENKENISYSIAMILFGAIDVGLGFLKSSRAFRIAGLVVLTIAVFKVAFIDLWNLGILYRIVVSLVLGVLLVASSFLYHKFTEKN